MAHMINKIIFIVITDFFVALIKYPVVVFGFIIVLPLIFVIRSLLSVYFVLTDSKVTKDRIHKRKLLTAFQKLIISIWILNIGLYIVSFILMLNPVPIPDINSTPYEERVEIARMFAINYDLGDLISKVVTLINIILAGAFSVVCIAKLKMRRERGS